VTPPLDLAALEAPLAKATTPSEWYSSGIGNEAAVDFGERGDGWADVCGTNAEANARLIVAAVNALPALVADNRALRKLLAIARTFVEPEALVENDGYGYFPGGDPRRFQPDEECCKPDEIERWKADCAAWERGERPDVGGPHSYVTDEEGRVLVRVTRAHYGLGSYTYRNQGAIDLLAAIDAALAAAEGAGEVGR
jgi:NAD(P)-dependent dehydrogenase (short-subunit alcohol dehydrogenase family)